MKGSLYSINNFWIHVTSFSLWSDSWWSNRTFHETVSFQLWIENIPHIVSQFIRRFQILDTAVIKAGLKWSVYTVNRSVLVMERGRVSVLKWSYRSVFSHRRRTPAQKLSEDSRCRHAPPLWLDKSQRSPPLKLRPQPSGDPPTPWTHTRTDTLQMTLIKDSFQPRKVFR